LREEKLGEEILRLKRERDAVILAHNYQRPEVQLIADYIGDSLDLARYSAKLDARTILLAGVNFMAEMAAILNPDKTVLIPDPMARCPMAGQLPAQKVLEAKEANPNAAVVLYVNTLAEAKAEADIVCTSANAPLVIDAMDEEEVLFGPDRNLAYFTQRHSGKRISPIPEDGYCYVHKMFSPSDIGLLKEEHPRAEILVHPECDPEVQRLADHVCSTSQMLLRAKASYAEEFIIGTEVGLVERLRREYPGKRFIPALDGAICKQMKRHTLQKVYLSLRDKKYVVRVPPKIAERARAAIDRMLEISGRAARD